MDVRTGAIKNNLEFFRDMCKQLSLDVYLYSVYLGAKWNHIYQATRINIKTVNKTIIRNSVVVECVCVCVCVCIYIYIYICIYIYR